MALKKILLKTEKKKKRPYDFDFWLKDFEYWTLR